MNGSMPTVAAFVLTVLVNGLWQAALLAATAWLVLRFARGANATTRHAVLVAALIGGILLPVVTTAIAFKNPRPEPTGAASPTQTQRIERRGPPLPIEKPAATLPKVDHPAAQIRHTEPVAVRPLGKEANATVTPPPAYRPRFMIPLLAVYVLVALWLAGAFLLVVRLAISLLYLERLKRDALPLPVEYRDRLERWDAIGKGTRDVRLCRSSEVAVPIAVGIFDAMILLPQRLLEDLPADDLDRILLHELAHLRRGDDWINALERVAEALFFFNPGIRWLVRQLDIEREVACDDWVLGRRNEALPYAQCLIKLVERVAWPYRPMTAPGVFVTRRSISIRIERLLAQQRDVRLRIAFGPIAALAGAAAAACLLAVYVSPSFASGGASAPTSLGKVTNDRTTGLKADHSKPSSTKTVATRTEPLQRAAQQRVALQPAPERSGSTKSVLPQATPQAESSASPLATVEPAIAPSQAPRLPRSRTAETRTLAATVVSRSTATHSAQATSSNGSQEAESGAAADADAGASGSGTPVPIKTGGDYIAEMAAAGYSNLSVDDLIRLKSTGVSAQYLHDLSAAGVGHLSVNEILQMRAVGVTGHYAGDMRRAFPGVNTGELVTLRAIGVTPDYVSQLRSAGLSNLSLDAVQRLRAVGVNGAYIRDLSAAGYPNLSADQLSQLKAVGIDGPFVRKVQAHGFHNLSLDDLVKLRVTGVLNQ